MKKILVLSLLFSIVANGFAQKVKILDGSIDALKGQTKMNVVFDYSNMGVGSYSKEEDYVTKKVKEYNEKEPGRGDDWAKKWEGDRKNRFEPSFTELFNKKSPVIIGNFADAKYTMKVRTTFTEPGYNIYVTRKNASINTEVTIYETASPDKAVCTIQGLNFPGRTFGGNDYDSGTRLSEAYAKAGKDLAAFIIKNLEK